MAVGCRASARFAVGIVIFSIAAGAFCRLVGIDVAMLRAESGVFLEAAYLTGQAKHDFMRVQLLTSYSGHFIPGALWLELQQSKLFHSHDERWFWRQMVALGFLGASLTWMFARIGRASGRERSALVVGASVAVIYVVQPSLLESAMWPITVLQILFFAITACAIGNLVRFAETTRVQDLNWFLLFAYLSMHVFGVGFAVSAAAVGLGLALTLMLAAAKAEDRGRRLKHRLAALVLAAVATAVHGYLMSALPGKQPVFSVDLSISTLRFFALYVESIAAGLRALWAPDGYPWPQAQALPLQATRGAAFFVISIISISVLGIRALRQTDAPRLIPFAILSFGFLSYTGYIVLTVYRIRIDPSGLAIAPFLIGGRYLAFPSFFILVTAAGLSFYVLPGFARLLAMLAGAGAVGATIGSYVFFLTIAPALWPNLKVNHGVEWRSAVAQARAEIARGKSVTNTSFAGIDPFNSDLLHRRHLLERSLGCDGCVRFAGE